LKITLYQFPAVPGQESLSSFCVKAHRLLAYKGLEYDVEVLVSGRDVAGVNPGVNKLPVVDVDGRRVIDSSRIAAELERLRPDPALFPDDPDQLCLAHFLEDWADEALYWFLVYSRWCVEPHFEAFAADALTLAPRPLRKTVGRLLRRGLKKALHAQGLGRFQWDVVATQLQGHLDQLVHRLAKGPYLVGDRLTVADLAVFGVIQGLHTPQLSQTRAMIEARPTLTDWATRVDEVTTGPHTVAWG